MRRTFPSRVAAFLVALLGALAGPGGALAHGLTHAHVARVHPSRASLAHPEPGHVRGHLHDHADVSHVGGEAHASARVGAPAPERTTGDAAGTTLAPAEHAHEHGHTALEVAPVDRGAGHQLALPLVVAVVTAPLAALDVRVVRPPAVTHPAALPRPDPATWPPGDSRAPPID